MANFELETLNPHKDANRKLELTENFLAAIGSNLRTLGIENEGSATELQNIYDYKC